MEIIIDNSYSKIININSSQKYIINKIWEKFSYEKDSDIYLKLKSKKFFKFDTRKHLYNRKTNTFPSGILNNIVDFLKSENISYKITDKREIPTKYLYLILSPNISRPRHYQSECLEIAKTNHRATFELCTGSGKTLIMIYLIKELGLNTLIITPSLALTQQTIKNCQLAFGHKYVGYHDSDCPIVVANYQSLPSKNPEWFKKFDLLIIDEAHSASTETIVNINKDCLNHIYFRYHFSATLFRNDGSDLELTGVVGDVSYRYPAKLAIKEGYISQPYFFIYNVHNQKHLNNHQDFLSEYTDLIVNNDQRNNLIAKIVEEIKKEQKSQILILVEHVNHGTILNNLISNSTYINGTMNENHNYKMIEDFNNNKIKVLIATDILSEGIDIVSCNTLILACGGKAKSSIIQKVGRVLRKNETKNKAIIIDFNDLNTNYLAKHSKLRQSYYKEFESKINVI